MGRDRTFDALSEAQVVAGCTRARGVPAEAAFRPAATGSMADLLDAIDRVAEAATGERSYLPPAPMPAAGRGAARRIA